jgi:hypothetical protein
MAHPRFRLVVFPESRHKWIARGLDHDLAAEGRTMEAAVDTLLKIARAHISFDIRHKREPLSGFSAAPRAYWEAFARGTRLALPAQLDWEDGGRPPRIIAAMVTEHPAIRTIAEVARTA